ncbi:MAG: ABC transporter ATP-binding protein [Paraclostridium sp.]
MIKKFETSNTKKLIDMINPYKVKYTLGVIGYSSHGYLLSLIMAITLKSVSNGIVDKNFILIKNSIYISIIFILILAIVNANLSYLYETSISSITKDLYKLVFEHVHKVDIDKAENLHNGDLLYTITNDVEITTSIYSSKIGDVLSAIISGVGGGVFIIYLNWQIGLFVIIVGILTVYLNKKFCSNLKQVNDNIKDINVSITESIMDIISNFKIIKIFNMEKFTLNKYESQNQNIFTHYLKRLKLEYKINSINYVIDFIRTTAIWIILGYFVFNKKISIGSMIAILEMTYQVSFMFSCLSEFMVELQDSIASSRRIFRFLNIEVEEENQSNTEVIDFSNKYALEIHNLKYINSEGEIILDDLNLSIENGSKVAILGVNGSGKSTLLEIIQGFKNNYEGELRIFGVLYKNIKKYEIRNNISYMPQSNLLYDDTVLFNILLDNPNVKMNEVYKYTTLFKINHLINDNDISNLSGGEKQKIALIRSLVNNFKVLILDEPTSNLDYNATDVFEHIITDKGNLDTVLCISHDIQSIKNFDEICILNNGKIAEKGNHTELIEAKGIYYSLYKQSIN